MGIVVARQPVVRKLFPGCPRGDEEVKTGADAGIAV
jgi:hypothetical protein